MKPFLAACIATSLALAAPAAVRAQATPAPYSLDGTFSIYTEQTSGVNAAGSLDTAGGPDRAARTDLSNALFVFAKNTGFFRFGITAGEYAFPTVGEAINQTAQAGANAALFGYVPSVYVAIVPNEHLTLTAGQLPALLGEESDFTYQNVNVQRGLVWALEPVFSRGVRATYVQGKFTGDLEYDDGYYTATHRAFEGLAGWAPSATTSFQFAFIVPEAGTPGNATSSIANKSEYDFMFTQQAGKLALMPYVLLVDSPASSALGYAAAESATGAALLAQYAFDSHFSVAARGEWVANASAVSDASPNADFLGYGPGSSATSLTVTPAYRTGYLFARVEFSSVRLANARAGLGFGPAGTAATQTRFVAETGLQF